MGTRGCIAVKQNNSWIGIYCSHDSYPLNLNSDLIYNLLKWLSKNRSLQDFCNELLKYSDWEHFKRSGLCPYCGCLNTGTPYNMSGVLVYNDDIPNYIKTRLKKYGVKDPFVEFHEHDDNDFKITPQNYKTYMIEYIYIIDPENYTIEVIDGYNNISIKTMQIPKNQETKQINTKDNKIKIVWWDSLSNVHDAFNINSLEYRNYKYIESRHKARNASILIENDINFRWFKVNKEQWKLSFIDFTKEKCSVFIDITCPKQKIIRQTYNIYNYLKNIESLRLTLYNLENKEPVLQEIKRIILKKGV